MTALGDLLELIHGARRSLGSVQGTLHEWRDEQVVGWLEIEYWPDPDGENRRWYPDEVVEQLIDFKLALPDRLRVEMRLPDEPPNSVVVCDGSRRATWFGGWGADVEDQNPNDASWVLGTAGRLLDPFWVLGFLELDSPRETNHAGRRALVTRGRPRYQLPWPLGPADEHELVFDPVRGTLLRIAGTWRRQEAFVHELTELEHDVTFDKETFEIAPPGVISGLGIQEVARLAGFQLWALPQPVLDVTYRPEPLESVTLTYANALVVLTSASIQQGWVSVGHPEQIERGERTYWLTERELVFAADGTWVRLEHDRAVDDELIDIAESFVRLP